jgi:hypothetical protein
MLQKHFHIGTCNADKYEAEEDVSCHPSPVGVPAVKQCQKETEPDPVKWDGPALCVTRKEEERRNGQASDNAPPVVVFHKKCRYDRPKPQRSQRFSASRCCLRLAVCPPNAWLLACLRSNLCSSAKEQGIRAVSKVSNLMSSGLPRRAALATLRITSMQTPWGEPTLYRANAVLQCAGCVSLGKMSPRRAAHARGHRRARDSDKRSGRIKAVVANGGPHLWTTTHTLAARLVTSDPVKPDSATHKAYNAQ